MKLFKYATGGGSSQRSIAHSTLGDRPRDHTDATNKTRYYRHRFEDAAAIEAHLRGGKMSIKLIAQMYGMSEAEVQKVSDKLWKEDPVYRMLRPTK